MQRLHYGDLFTITFSDTADTEPIEAQISKLMGTAPGEHGWLVLNHPTEAGTQVKLSVTNGVPIIFTRQQGEPVVGGNGTVWNWVFLD